MKKLFYTLLCLCTILVASSSVINAETYTVDFENLPYSHQGHFYPDTDIGGLYFTTDSGVNMAYDKSGGEDSSSGVFAVYRATSVSITRSDGSIFAIESIYLHDSYPDSGNEGGFGSPTYTIYGYLNGTLKYEKSDVNVKSPIKINFDWEDGIDELKLVAATESIRGYYDLAATIDNIVYSSINSAPVVTTDTGVTVNEGHSVRVSESLLEITDAEQVASEITYTLTKAPSNGTLKKNGTTLVANNIFTQEDINNGNIRYTHDGTDTATDAFEFKVSDGDGGEIEETSFDITVTNENDAPFVENNKGLSIEEDGSETTITTDRLKVIDEEGSQVTYTVTSVPSKGVLKINEVAITGNETFTQLNIDDNQITYTPIVNEYGVDAFSFKVLDDEAKTTSGTFSITINGINDAPVLIANNGFTVNEGTSNVVSQSILEITDVDQVASKITYTLKKVPSNGILENDGTTLVVNNTFTQEDVNNGDITYTHDGSETSTDAFKFTVSDGDGGEIEEKTFDITVTLENDAPFVEKNIGLSIDEDVSATTITSSELCTKDEESEDQTLTYTLTSVPSKGVLNNNGVAIASNETFTQSDIDSNKITYTPNENEDDEDSFSFSVSDDKTGTTTGTFNITITGINDAPIVTTNDMMTVIRATSNVVSQSILETTDLEQMTSEIIYTLTEVTTNGTLAKTGTAFEVDNTFTQEDINKGDITYTHDGSAVTSDSFKFKVSDGDDGEIQETTFEIKITEKPAKESDDDDSPTTESKSDVTIINVGGEEYSVGRHKDTTNESGQTVNTITINDMKLEEILGNSKVNSTITLLLSNESDVIISRMNGQTVKAMEEKGYTFEIKTEKVSYVLPASQINIDSVIAQLDAQVEFEDVEVSIKIADPSPELIKVVEARANEGDYQLVIAPVQFEIICSNNGKSVEVSNFEGYVERRIAIPEGVDPSKITTGIVVNEDGSFRPVPTKIIEVDGKYYAKISSLTNSTYSAIYNAREFVDVKSHWAQDVINDMASRKILNGYMDGTFIPDQEITRAEFATIVVGALGLVEGIGDNDFEDVEENDWYYEYIEIASNYGIITDNGDGYFLPEGNITCEQALVMIVRAMSITNLDYTLTVSEIEALLAGYSDAIDASADARESIAACLKTGVLTKSDVHTLVSKDYITRAEVVIMVRRLLQISGLI